ncbi:hypothetical protein EVAR_65485_1 [Eumeta japonica]|uniref:Uncharacterized protein n=1 Tax=Eumeta variegata TaxID=151549 RepID=A0A4C1SJ15_EUMVA|nr:hypothetical protein EVAR_65485_1 [Eumeta japonica]
MSGNGNLSVDKCIRHAGVLLFSTRAFQRNSSTDKLLEADKRASYLKLVGYHPPSNLIAQSVGRQQQLKILCRPANTYLPESPWGHQPPWYRFNPRVGLEKQSYSTAIGLLSSEDLAANYQSEALLGLYTPKAERQGVAPHQDQTCPRGKH